MKFLFLGDAHNQVRTPANRTDDFHETFRNKVEEIKKIAKEENVKAILQPGDFLNSPQYNNDFVMNVVRMWSFVPEKYELLEDLRQGKGNVDDIANRLQEDIPYIGAVGNHELIGESIKSYPRTSIAFMEELGFMKMASKEEPIIFTDDDGTKVAITATHYHHGMDEPEHVNDYIVDEKAGDIHIHMVHGYLAAKDLGPLITHTLVDAVQETKADLTLAGHDHIGFSPVTIDGKQFANPGSLTRTKADVKEISRSPKVLIIEVKDGKVTLTERELETAKPGDKVLDRTSILKRAAKSSKIESIKSIVNKAKISKGNDVTDIIKAVADAETLDESVTGDVVKRVTDKMEEMGRSTTASVEPYKLSQIVLENFQSHEHSIFDISEGLNIFTGESSNGKSAVMRAMRWLIDNQGKSQRESFIRHGADFAKVTALFDNGKMISRIIHTQAHKDNGWEIYDPATGETHAGNTRMLGEIQEHFGFTKIQYDVNDELDVNFMNQGDGWYFIGDHVTASKRAKIIGAIFGTHYTDAVMRDLERDLRKIRQESKVREEDVDKLQKKIDEFDYLDEFENRLHQVEKLVSKLGKLDDKKKIVDNLITMSTDLNEQEKHLKDVLIKSKGLTEASNKMIELERTYSHYQQVVNILQRQTAIIHEGRVQRKLTEELQDIEVVSKKFTELDNIYRKHAQLTTLIKDESVIAKGLTDTKTIISNLKNTDMATMKVETLIELVERHKKLSSLVKEETSIKTSITKGIQFVKDLDVNINTLQDQYKQLLDDNGHCPTCGQVVNDEALESHLVQSH